MRATPELDDAELAIVISSKAETYKRAFAGAMLTPTALAKHWPQLDAKLIEQEAQKTTVVSNRIIYPSQCATCEGDRQVLVGYRPPFPTLWAIEHRSKKHPHLGLQHPDHRKHEDGFEEYLPCPDCNPQARADVIEHQRRFERRWPRRLPGVPVQSNKRSPSREE